MTKIIHPDLKEKLQLTQLDVFSHGDPLLRRKLVELMIENVMELRNALALLTEGDAVGFRRACHKVKTTLDIIDSPALTGFVDDLKKGSNDPDRVAEFSQLCLSIIMKLKEEMK